MVREIFPPRDSESPPISDREYFINAVQTKRAAISDVILGRLSYVPIITIAVPIFDAGGGDRRRRRRIARPLEIRSVRRATSGRCRTRALPCSISTSRVIFTSGQTSFTALQSLAHDDWSLASAQARDGVFRYGRKVENASESARLAAVAVMRADRLEGVCRTAAAQHSPAVDRLLRVRARA